MRAQPKAWRPWAGVGLALVLALPGWHSSAVGDDSPSVLLNLTNQARGSVGLLPLSQHWDLADDASAHAANMAAAGQIFHNPGLTSATSGWRVIGENVGAGGSAVQIHESFLDSPPHLANILYAPYDYVGVGAAWSGARLWVSVVFMDAAVSFRPPFADDDYSMYESAIVSLHAAGIVVGCGPQRFCPEDAVTSEQLATMLARSGHPVAAASPNAMTRSEAAELLSSVLGLSPNSTDYFSDDNGSIGETAINALAAAGITSGCGGGKFCPRSYLTRGEAATMLARALGI